MSVTDAAREAYASQPKGENWIETVQFDHSTFETPLRIATGVSVDTNLPLTFGGTPVTFLARQIAVTPPGQAPDGPIPMRIQIDNVVNLLLPYFRAAEQATDPIVVTYRAYTSSDRTKPCEDFGELELRDVELDAIAASAAIGFREIELQAFPNATYDQQYYPALQES